MPRHDALAQAPLTRTCGTRRASALAAALGGGVDVEWVESTGSTNADLMSRVRLAEALAPTTLRIADAQIAGRGRLGRPWRSTPGASLAFSLSVRLARDDLSGLSIAIGVAVADALDSLGGDGAAADTPSIGLKWPNDLCLVGADADQALGATPWRKCGGILVETAPAGGGRVGVIGVGLNLRAQAAVDGASVGALDERCAGATPERTLLAVVPALLEAVAAFERGGLDDAVRARYAARDVLAGRAIRAGRGIPGRIERADDDIEGTGAGIGRDGALMVRVGDGRLVEVSSGEVSVRLLSRASAGSAAC